MFVSPRLSTDGRAVRCRSRSSRRSPTGRRRSRQLKLVVEVENLGDVRHRRRSRFVRATRSGDVGARLRRRRRRDHRRVQGPVGDRRSARSRPRTSPTTCSTCTPMSPRAIRPTFPPVTFGPLATLADELGISATAARTTTSGSTSLFERRAQPTRREPARPLHRPRRSSPPRSSAAPRVHAGVPLLRPVPGGQSVREP